MFQLSKNSGSEDIKKYFLAVLKLAKASKEFPVNLDEVWPLAYPRKDHAVRELTESQQFIQNIDYQVFPKKEENPQGGRPTNEYFLTTSCLEFFIARKVRAVFDVYRKVFHNALGNPNTPCGFEVPQSFSEALLLAAQQQQQIEQANRTIDKLQPRADFADKAFATDGKVDIGQAAKILNLGYGRNILFKKLKEIGVFFSNRNEPKQRYIDACYFELKEQIIHRDDHPSFTVMKCLVTQKGLAYINKLLGGNPSDGKTTKIL